MKELAASTAQVKDVVLQIQSIRSDFKISIQGIHESIERETNSSKTSAVRNATALQAASKEISLCKDELSKLTMRLESSKVDIAKLKMELETALERLSKENARKMAEMARSNIDEKAPEDASMESTNPLDFTLNMFQGIGSGIGSVLSGNFTSDGKNGNTTRNTPMSTAEDDTSEQGFKVDDNARSQYKSPTIPITSTSTVDSSSRPQRSPSDQMAAKQAARRAAEEQGTGSPPIILTTPPPPETCQSSSSSLSLSEGLVDVKVFFSSAGLGLKLVEEDSLLVNGRERVVRMKVEGFKEMQSGHPNPSQANGIRMGDVIEKINGRRYNSVDLFLAALTPPSVVLSVRRK